MALLFPITGAPITQGFGPSIYPQEPAAYGNTVKASFSPETGLFYYERFHTAIDIAAAEGTHILASESGVVTRSGWDSSGGGNSIVVQIRPGVNYSSNHCKSIYIGVGGKVSRGQVIATVGDTGLANGFHDHFWVERDEVVSGVLRHNYYDPKLFLPGGKLADDPSITPIAVVVYAVIPPNVRLYTACMLDLAHDNPRDLSKTIELKYLGAMDGQEYEFGDAGARSTVWAILDAGNAAHTRLYTPYNRVQSFVDK